MDRGELWDRARDDAGFRPEEAVWYELPGVPRTQTRTPYLPSLSPAPVIRRDSIDDAATAWSSLHHDRVRVLTYRGFDDAAVLGAMRWGLEYARLDQRFNAAMKLIGVTHLASQQRIIALGAGGASYHHAAPDQRQPNAAASILVNDVLGPQLGEFRKNFGPLFRNADDAMSDDVFTRRAVAFAAFHREDIEAWEASSRVALDRTIAMADSSGAQWWTALLQDDAFQRLSAAGRVVMPKRDETDAAKRAAALLWDTAIDLYKRGERRALEIMR